MEVRGPGRVGVGRREGWGYTPGAGRACFFFFFKPTSRYPGCRPSGSGQTTFIPIRPAPPLACPYLAVKRVPERGLQRRASLYLLTSEQSPDAGCPVAPQRLQARQTGFPMRALAAGAFRGWRGGGGGWGLAPTCVCCPGSELVLWAGPSGPGVPSEGSVALQGRSV